ncbi:hypothetical protein E8E13_007785 [Curvularia kusanoi]|uniref:Uncharacterized protein n=1 Tax=Curvularia kusanoi TaxID=90978 RepID=A0A9P4TB67_CURKU|nr:hypothetical protein E8E13_007785 [Curvularia kusanoi]
MAPKKAASSNPTEGGKFTWEGANENKLLLIIFGRHVTTAEHEEVAQAFPGATAGAIRNRIGILRGKQKKLYEDLGWEDKLPSAGSAPASAKKAKTTQAKRALDADVNDEEMELETSPSKKARATPRKKKDGKTKTKIEDIEAEDGSDEGGVELGGRAKKEEEIEEVV